MNKGKLIITVGISGSGKSTWVQSMWSNDHKNVVIVNRDKIRELLFGFSEDKMFLYYKLVGLNELEKQVTKYENVLIKEGLSEGKNVIVDATHLKREYLKRFKYFNVPTELKFFDVNLDTAIARDSNRNREVGKDVITRQYNQYKSLLTSLKEKPINFTVTTIECNHKLPPCIIFDIDGTIAHMEDGGRSPFDWKRVGEDSVDKSLEAVFKSIEEDIKLIFCTGRDAVCIKETVKWLEDHGLHFTEIFMRRKNDYRPDWIVKQEMWTAIAEDYNIIGMFDDRCQVVDRARSLGLKVFQVEYNNF